MKINRFGGIDTGAHGAMCVINGKGLVLGCATPQLLDHGRDSNNPADRYNIKGFFTHLHQHKAKLFCDRVLIEKPFRPSKLPRGYIMSARDESYLWFSYALWHSQLVCLGICEQENLHPVHPKTWKAAIDDGTYKWMRKHGGKGDTKKASVEFAMRLCPDRDFRTLIVNTTGDLKHGYAEAYLIALFCVQQFKHDKK